MFTSGGTYSQIGNNGVKSEQKHYLLDNKHSHTNQDARNHQSKSAKASFIKRFNPFSKSKSQTINGKGDCVSDASLNDKEYTSVKVLKQFWNEQIKTAKSTENLNRKSATIRYFSQSNDSINEKPLSRAEKSQTLDGRLPIDEFNKFKDADFVRNKKNRLKYFTGNVDEVKSSSRPENFAVHDSCFPQISATGGKIHWPKREDIFNKKCHNENDDMSVKSSKNSTDSSGKKGHSDSRKESMSSSIGSFQSTASSNTNSMSRKVSFKTSQASASSYMNRKIATTSSGTKVAQIAQRFNQMIQQDATILDEVKKRGTVVLHRSGGCVFKIKEEKVDSKATLSLRKSFNDDGSDDCASLPSIASIGKNSTRKKSSLKKRPSIRILVESPRKDGKGGNVLSKKQLYETNVVNKETIVVKPKVPDKSDRVLQKTKELKTKKLNEIQKTETKSLPETIAPVDDKIDEPCETVQSPAKDHKKNNFQKIYDKISFRPTFLYGKKVSKLETTLEVNAKSTEDVEHRDDISKDNEDELEFQPIDMNLNVYFNNENLSVPLQEDGNVNSQSPVDDVMASEECILDQSAVKPNESFLFRSQFGSGKLDVFIRDMLVEDFNENIDNETLENATKIESEAVNCNSGLENNYEVVSKGLTTGGERVDIDKNGSSSNRDEACEENIYQSLCEVKGDTESVKSYESFENYDEIAQNILDNKISLEDLMKVEEDYIFPEKAPEPPPPRKNTIPRISSPILTSTTSNLVQPDIQVPKLKFNYELQKSSSCASTTYEKIQYDQLPSITQQQKHRLPLRNAEESNENIYDTIKNGDNRSLILSLDKLPEQMKVAQDESDSFHIRDENDNPYRNSKNDTMSIISNCYESISFKQNYSTINQILRHAISTSTLSSEHRINSIYGTMVGQSLTPPSDRSASDNSDEWIDLSDEDNDSENVTDNRFIV